MALMPFSFESIHEIDDGVIDAAMNRAIRAAFLDMDDRPEVTAKRSISLTLELEPVMERGHLRWAEVSFKVKDTLPAKSILVRMNASHDGLEFSPSQPQNPDQKDIPFPKDK